MSLLSLLFDPRGAIDRRAFWSGLIQLTIVSLAVVVGLTVVDMDVAWAALPAVGEAWVLSDVAGHLRHAALPDVPLLAGVFLVAARLYATACLMLKRARDAGKRPHALIVLGLASLLVHVLVGFWVYDLFPDGMAIIAPLAADAMVTAVLGLVFTTWLGALRSSPASGPARSWRLAPG
ncbi:hypothetical protein ASD38_17460 [Caulobacter sp. Root487D2Y]|uniref:hypothetical protein n=1 Tax=Caulobacter sp. Root487D2Y TaxID=1736547 RepID=UPI0006F8AC03|nr:hypothetical protein [Caulobacter sp. Root487D2Y]KQY27687.1 hypothetical protein ASD38_17460 [Caulobacter sp. Root487D2Y]